MINKNARELAVGDRVVVSADGKKYFNITAVDRNAGIAGVLYPVIQGINQDGLPFKIDTGSTPNLQDNIYKVIPASPLPAVKKKTATTNAGKAKNVKVTAAAKNTAAVKKRK